MSSLPRKKGLHTGLLAAALVPLAAVPVSAQSGWPTDDGYVQPQYQPQYAQQYAQPQQLTYAPQQPVMAQQPMAPDQLEQLVAPIALYPDALVAQILAASTYPAQLAAADQWLHTAGFASPDQVAMAANTQTMWDPSVKALTAFPQVLDMLSGNLQWTTALGNAYYNQPQDVLQTVQVMRMRAQQAGNLVPTAQEQVIQSPGYISLAPVNPDVVYVPTYNPWVVYGAPLQPYPGFNFCGILGGIANTFFGGGYGDGYGGGFGSSPLQYLLSFALGAFNHTPFGLISWGLDWLGNLLTFNNDNYWTNSTSVVDWGLPNGGPRYPRAYPGGGFRGQNRLAFGNNYNHQPIPIHGGPIRGGNHFAGNNPMRPQPALPRPEPRFGQRPGLGQQPGFGRPEGRPILPPQQQAYNHVPQPIARTPYGNGFAPRAQSPMMPARPSSPYEPYRNPIGGVQPRRPSYPSPNYGSYNRPSPNYGNYNYNRPGSMSYAAPQNYHQERSGGFFGGGGGYKEPKFSYKEPKMPKYHEPKMPSFKAPHESHFGGGGGGHFGGGGHSSGGGHHHF